MKNDLLKFRDFRPNMKVNPLPEHDEPSIRMVEVCLEEYLIYDINLVKTPLSYIHAKVCKAGLFGDDHTHYQSCEQNLKGCTLVKKDIYGLMDQGILCVSTKHKEDEDPAGTQFQALDIINVIQKSGASISSFKDAQQNLKSGQAKGWGKIVELPENKNKVGLGFSPCVARRALKHEYVIRPIQ